jgi:hypothetical protein
VSEGVRDKLVELMIREARARGEFDDLPGQGAPLAPDESDKLPPEQRFAALVLRSSGEVSEEISLLREIRELRAALTRAEDPAERERLAAELRARADTLAHRVRDAHAADAAATRPKREP